MYFFLTTVSGSVRPVLMVNELQVSSLKFHDFYLIVQIHPLLMVGGFIVVSSEGQPNSLIKKTRKQLRPFFKLHTEFDPQTCSRAVQTHDAFGVFSAIFFLSAEVDFLSGLGCVVLKVQPSLSSNLWEGRSGLRRRFT